MYLQVVRISSGSVEEIGRFHKFRSERMLTPVHLEVRGKRFRQEIVTLHHLVKHFVRLNCWLQLQWITLAIFSTFQCVFNVKNIQAGYE